MRATDSYGFRHCPPCSKNTITLVIAASMIVGLGAAGCTRSAGNSNGKIQNGMASWYGQQFQGRLTASGERFDMEKMTAAHRTLPFGTKVRVQNLVNDKTTEVFINDRGPFVGDRIIDLSHAAAQTIAMPGVGKVRLEVLSTPPTRGADLFAVQIGAFTQRAEAERVSKDMQAQYGAARPIFRESDRTWRVLVGLEPTEEAATALAQKLEKQSGPALVVRVDTD